MVHWTLQSRERQVDADGPLLFQRVVHVSDTKSHLLGAPSRERNDEADGLLLLRCGVQVCVVPAIA